MDVGVDLANGLPALTVLGLPEAEVMESKDRRRAAIKDSSLEFPTRRITVNLAPAELPKEAADSIWRSQWGILAVSSRGSASALA